MVKVQKRSPEQANQKRVMNAYFQKVLTIARKSKPPTDARGMTRSNTYWQADAHMVPQYDFIYQNSNNKNNKNHQSHAPSVVEVVQHVLKYETLADDFNALMEQYNLTVRLTPDDRQQVVDGKKLTVNDVSKANIALINELYRQDFEMFGYDIVSRKT